MEAIATSPMQGSVAASQSTGRWKVWLGRALTALAVLFLLMDGSIKVLELPFAVSATVALGFPADTVFGIGLVELVFLALFLVPRTSLLGAMLLTAHLGGAVAANVRAQSPLFSHTLFSIYFSVILWGGLYLRREQVRSVLPLLSPETR